jgi:hypothetical protein
MIINSINSFLFFISLLFNSGPVDQEIIQSLLNYSLSLPQEKVYLQTDKSNYFPGEDIWYKAYLMMGPNHVPDSITEVLYVELINNQGRVVNRQSLHMQAGLGWGDFKIPDQSSPGKYIMKAYTRYMMNFDPAFYYRKPILIISDSQSVDEQSDNPVITDNIPEIAEVKPLKMEFFPEGGNTVTGIQNFVAFKSTTDGKKGIDINGIIKNGNGEEILDFETRKFGMGLFSFTPESGDKYFAHVKFRGEEYIYDLPDALEKSYAMHLKLSGDKIYVWVRNNMGINMDNSFIIGQFRGFPFITIHAEPDQDFIYSVFSIKDIPNGIIQFTFFDAQGVPHCERLVYSENETDVVNFKVGTSKKRYRRREKIDFNIHCEDLEGAYPLTNISVSIVNDSIFSKNRNNGDIASYFNLESDLKGYIENPGYYFDPENADRSELLDNLLLTHGWRRFVWKEIMNEENVQLQYNPEFGFDFEGNVFENIKLTRPSVGKVRLFIYEGQFYFNEIETDEKGRFQFLGIDIYDTTQVVMQAWENTANEGKKKKKKSLETRKRLAIKIDPIPYASLEPALWPELPRSESIDYSDYYELNDLIFRIDSSFEGKTIMLNEILVEDTKVDMDDPFYRLGKLHGQPTRRIVMDSIPVSEQSLLFFQLVRKYYPNVNYRGTPPEIDVIIRGQRSIAGNSSALIILDGIEVTSDFMYYFPVSEIDFIDVLSSIGASIYGSGSMGGAIVVFTRERQPVYNVEEPDWVHNFAFPGYYRAREFYTPDYGMPEEKHVKPDFRRTLYWNPSLTTDHQGNIGFSFYSSDERAKYRVEIEGMTYEGIPITNEYYFSVE